MDAILVFIAAMYLLGTIAAFAVMGSEGKRLRLDNERLRAERDAHRAGR
jgi:hypothetical protein